MSTTVVIPTVCQNPTCSTKNPDRHPSHPKPVLLKHSNTVVWCADCGWTNEPGVEKVSHWLEMLGYKNKYGTSVAKTEHFMEQYSKHPVLASCHYTEERNQGNLQHSCGGEVILLFPRSTPAAQVSRGVVAIVRSTAKRDRWLHRKSRGELTEGERYRGAPWPKLIMVMMG